MLHSIDFRGKMVTVKDGCVLCPQCLSRGQSHSMTHVRPDTQLVNFPAFCKHCKTEILINLEPEPVRLRR